LLISVIPAFRRWRQDTYEFATSLGYKAIHWNLGFKSNDKKTLGVVTMGAVLIVNWIQGYWRDYVFLTK
jgi:hypothetical protein